MPQDHCAPTGYEDGFEWIATVSSWLVFMLAGPGRAVVFPSLVTVCVRAR